LGFQKAGGGTRFLADSKTSGAAGSQVAVKTPPQGPNWGGAPGGGGGGGGSRQGGGGFRGGLFGVPLGGRVMPSPAPNGFWGPGVPGGPDWGGGNSTCKFGGGPQGGAAHHFSRGFNREKKNSGGKKKPPGDHPRGPAPGTAAPAREKRPGWGEGGAAEARLGGCAKAVGGDPAFWLGAEGAQAQGAFSLRGGGGTTCLLVPVGFGCPRGGGGILPEKNKKGAGMANRCR